MDSIIVPRELTNQSIVLRVLVVGLLFYYGYILVFAYYWQSAYYLIGGLLYWNAYGHFLPIPTTPGDMDIITYAGPIETAFYIVFIYDGVWIVWITLTLVFVFSPFTNEIRSIISKIR
ncbi:MAG: hypothetical protein ACW98U_00660 [Candidatus Thorarchaeota archaeon]|jgi:hypothetical protein